MNLNTGLKATTAAATFAILPQSASTPLVLFAALFGGMYLVDFRFDSAFDIYSSNHLHCLWLEVVVRVEDDVMHGVPCSHQMYVLLPVLQVVELAMLSNQSLVVLGEVQSPL